MRGALEGSVLSILEQVDLAATRLAEKEAGRTPGSTAIEGLSGSARAGASCTVADTAAVATL